MIHRHYHWQQIQLVLRPIVTVSASAWSDVMAAGATLSKFWGVDIIAPCPLPDVPPLVRIAPLQRATSQSVRSCHDLSASTSPRLLVPTVAPLSSEMYVQVFGCSCMCITLSFDDGLSPPLFVLHAVRLMAKSVAKNKLFLFRITIFFYYLFVYLTVFFNLLF